MVGCLTLFLITSMGYAQSGDDGDTNTAFDYTAELSRAVTIPNSPEAAAFIKYGDIPLNHYTGTPNISIPICEIKGRSVSMPVSMTYDASGIKVNQLATNVGLGWNLNYGGVVSRQVLGLPDQANGDFAHIADDNTRKGLAAFYSSPNMTTYSSAQDLAYGEAIYENYRVNGVDTQADTFSFNVNGLSGTIGINYDVSENGAYQVFCIENPTIKIDYRMQGGHITSWIITDTNGTSYEFAKGEYTHTSYSTEQNEYTAEYISSWYLTKVETANKEDVITYHYSNGEYYLNNQHLPINVVWEYYRDPRLHTAGPDPNVNLRKEEIEQKTQTIYKIKRFNLTHILHNDRLMFSANSNVAREDLEGQSAISDVFVYNTLGETTKQFAFDYTYFTTGSATQNHEKNKRLKLDAIREIEVLRNSDGTIITSNITPREKAHRFEYFRPNELPARDAESLDLWGYYNGKTSNHMVMGNTTHFNEQHGVLQRELEVEGANRRADIHFALNGTLQKITYPTGGTTTFFYDSHRGPFEEDTELSIRPESVDVIGGHDNPIQNTIDLDDCQDFDDVGYVYNLQNSGAGGFTIDADNAARDILFDVKFSDYNAGPPQPNTGEVTFLCIYKSQIGTGQCATYPCPESEIQPNGCSLAVSGDTYTVCDDGDAPLTYCDIITNVNNPNIVYMDQDPGEDFSLRLEEGDYRILLVNGRPDTHLKVDYDIHYLSTRGKVNTVGGLRLIKTESSPSEDAEDKLTKYYYYDTLPEDELITPDIINRQSSSSGVIHQKLIFSDRETHHGKVSESTTGHCPQTTYFGVDVLKFYNYNIAPQTKYKITYSNVSEVLFKNNEYQGHTSFNFYNSDDGSILPHKPYFPKRHLNGNLRTTTHYNNQKQIVQQSSQEYTQQVLNDAMPYNGVYIVTDNVFVLGCVQRVSENGLHQVLVNSIDVIPQCPGGGYELCPGGETKAINTFIPRKYRLIPVWTRLEAKTERQFFEDQVVEQTTNYFYENDTHKQLTRTQTTKSDGQINISKMYYPQDREQLGTLSVTANKAIDDMIDTHRIGMPLQVEQYSKQGAVNTLLAKQRTDYGVWGIEKQVFPEMIYTSKASDSLQERMRYHSYDTNGNPLEVSQTGGIHSIYIWGYNNTYPIAKIDNASYDGMPTAVTNLIDQIKTTSNTENNSTKEATLRSQLETLRSHAFFADGEMSYYTYDPQIGVTSMTDPRGYTMYYEYDGFNRLSVVKDEDGNILSENQYHYKNN